MSTDNEEELGFFLFLAIMFWVLTVFIMGIIISSKNDELKQVKKEAVIRGYALYDVSNLNGDPKFTWKEKAEK